MKKPITTALTLLPVFIALLILTAEPIIAMESARRGLSVCAQSIIPSLFPFFVLSGLLSTLGLPQRLGRCLRRPMAALGAPGAAAVPLAMGLLGGYPLGASTLAELVEQGELTPVQAARLLPWCANTGPSFILGAVGGGVFASPRCGLILYLTHLLAALTLARFSRCPPGQTDKRSVPATPTLPTALPAAIRSAAAATVNICAYVVFFSVITGLLTHMGLFAALAGMAAERFGWELRFTTALLTGLLELGSGVGAMAGLPPTGPNMALAAFLLGFGGLSVHCQTLSAVENAKIKCARHFAGRMVHGALAALYTCLIVTLLRI